MIRVAVFRDLSTDRSTSMTRYTDDLVSGLATRAGISVMDLAYPGTDQPVDSLKRTVRRYNERYWNYPRYVRATDADIYHIPNQAYAHLVAAAPLLRSIVTVHDIIWLTLRNWGGPGYFRPAHWLSVYSVRHVSRAAHVVAVSEATRADLLSLDLVKPENVSVIPPGLSDAFTYFRGSRDEALRQRIGLAENELAVLHVGKDTIYKNMDGVVDCVAELRRRGYPAKFVRVGDSLTPRLKELLAHKELTQHIIDLGHLSDATLAEVYASSDVLLFPSLKEGFGWPVVEAMACGLPVVASTADALTELVDGVGLQAPASDTQGLCNAIEQIWTNHDLHARCISMGFEKSKKFSKAKTVEQLDDIYHQVAEQAELNTAGS